MRADVVAGAAGSKLSKEIGALQFFTLAFGAVVGSGWAVVLGDWLTQAGPAGAMLGLASGGVVIAIIGLCYGEVSSLIPVSGGEMAYAYEAFGERACFYLGWFMAGGYIVVTSFEAISIGWILGALIPSWEGPTIYTSLGGEVHAGTLAVGLLSMVVITWLNYRGAKAAARLQDTLVIALLVLATVFIGAGVVRGDPANLQPLFVRSASGSVLPGVIALFMTASFWFGGFNVVPQAMEEKSPGTKLANVGVMIVLSIVIGVVFKTLVVFAASMTMPWKQLTTAKVPVATAFEVALGSRVLAKLVLVTALCGLFSTWNSVHIGASRALFALGRAGFLSEKFATVHPTHGSPSFAVLFVGVLGALGTLLGRQAILPIVTATATCLCLGYLVTCATMIRLRLRDPNQRRPFTAPGGMLTAIVGLLGAIVSLVLSLYQPYVDAKGRLPLEWILLAVWLVAGVGAWAMAGARRAQVGAVERRRVIMGAEA